MAAPIAGNSKIVVGVYVTTTDAIAALNRFSHAAQRSLSDIGRHVVNSRIQFQGLNGMVSLLAGGALVAAATAFAKLGTQLQQTSMLMITLEGSTKGAADQMDRMVLLANKVPYSLNSISNAFVKMKTAGIEPIIDAQGNGPLRNLLDAVSAFGGSEQNLARAAIAIQQMSGKGVISMEELRQQMGEAVPSAMAIMAEKMGMSMAQLTIEVSKGNVEATKGLNAMLEGFGEKYGKLGEKIKAVSLQGSFQGVSNEMTKFAVALDRIGVIDVLTVSVQMFTKVLSDLNARFFGPAGLAGSTSAVATALEGMHDWVVSNSFEIAKLLNVFLDLLSIMQSFVTIVMSFLAGFPPGMAAGGMIGFALFGGLGGIIPGMLLGQCTHALAGFAKLVAGIISAIPSDMLAMGLIGFVLFGKVGKIATAIVLTAMAVQKFLDWMLDKFASAVVGMGAMLSAMGKSIMSGEFLTAPGKVLAESWAKAGTAADRYYKKIQADNLRVKLGARAFADEHGLSWMVGGSGGGPVKGTAIAAAADDAMARLKQMRVDREAIASAQSALATPVGLDAADVKRLGSIATAYQSIHERLLGITQGPGAQIREAAKKDIADSQAMVAKYNAEAVALEARASAPGVSAAAAANFRRQASEKIETAKQVNGLVIKMAKETAELADAADAKVSARAGARAARNAAKIAKLAENEKAKLATIANSVEGFQAKITLAQDKVFGGSELKRAGDAAIEEYSAFGVSIANAIVQVEKLKNKTPEQIALLNELAAAQLKLNLVTAQAVKLAEEKAKWALKDQQLAREELVRSNMLKLDDLRSSTRIDFSGGVNKAKEDNARTLAAGLRDFDRQIEEQNRALAENAGTLAAAQIISTRDQLEAQKALFAEYYDWRKQEERNIAQAATELYQSVGDSVRSSLEKTLVAFAQGGASMKDIMMSMYAEITAAAARYIIKLMIIKMLEMSGNPFLMGMGSFLSGSSGIGVPKSANGNVFSGGSMQKFASGGAFTNKIVSGPTMFNMGLMGEAGPEGILPLVRIGGKLGVHATGGGGGDQYSVHINAVDAKSIRDLLLANGDALIPAIVAQGRLNNGVGRMR